MSFCKSPSRSRVRSDRLNWLVAVTSTRLEFSNDTRLITTTMAENAASTSRVFMPYRPVRLRKAAMTELMNTAPTRQMRTTPMMMSMRPYSLIELTKATTTMPVTRPMIPVIRSGAPRKPMAFTAGSMTLISGRESCSSSSPGAALSTSWGSGGSVG